jgi:hypothetical protein
MSDTWLFLHEVRTRDLEEEVRRAMHRRAAAELRRRERERVRSARWARVVAAVRRRHVTPAPCPTC